MLLATFVTAALAGALLVLLSFATLVWPALRFWPPPNLKSWQYATFWWLFRVMVTGVFLLSYFDFDGYGNRAAWQYLVGVPLALVGFGLAVHSLYVYILLALWFSMYLIAPLLEEPWLEERYGQTYRKYKSEVPRFVGRRHRAI